MTTYEIRCDGPGPHDPADGVLGTSSLPGPHGVRCGSDRCRLPVTLEPLDATGALAALLAVQGVLTVDDAASAVGVAPDRLVSEVEAWAAAAELA